MNNRLKNIFLFLIPFALSAMAIVAGYLWEVPQNPQILKPFMPKTLFSLSNAPLDSLQGQIASVSGKVGWISRTASTASLINSPIKIQQGEEIDTYNNGTATVNFPKIGTVTLSHDTQINFVQTLPQNFVAEQKQGEASFEKNGNVPISIVALDLLVNMENGTAKISLDKKINRITVIVSSGSATLAYTDLNNNTDVLTLQSGNTYIFDDNTRTGITE